MKSQIDIRATAAMQEVKDGYDLAVAAGTAVADSFEFLIRKRDKRERNLRWSWHENTPDGLMLKSGSQDILTF